MLRLALVGLGDVVVVKVDPAVGAALRQQQGNLLQQGSQGKQQGNRRRLLPDKAAVRAVAAVLADAVDLTLVFPWSPVFIWSS